MTLVIPPSAITPLKVVLALLSVRVWAPSLTLPTPAPLLDKVLIDAPALVPEISKVPLAATLLEVAMLPVPVNASVVLAPTVVAPV